jgi:hypothetical protein
VEERHTLTHFSAGPSATRWRPSQVLSWIGLAIVALTTAYALQLTAAALVYSASVNRPGGTDPDAAGSDVSDKRGAAIQAPVPSSTRVVSITGVDAAKDDRIQVVCVAAGDRSASPTLLVELNDLRDVSALVCTQPDPPAIRSGSDY